MKKLLPGSLLAIVMIAIGAWVVLQSGLIPIAASSKPDFFDELAPQVRDRAVARQARPITTIPGHPGPESIQRGLVHYRENCLPCHGAPDASAAEFSAGLNPGPPPLEVDIVQRPPDNELFWIVKTRDPRHRHAGLRHQSQRRRDRRHRAFHAPPAEADRRGQGATVRSRRPAKTTTY